MLLTGREVLKTNVKEITKDNVVEVLNSVLPAFRANAADSLYLYNFYLGRQGTEAREKLVRPEIKNDITVNHAQEIVNFKTNYIYSDPIKYVKHNEVPDSALTDEIAVINQMMMSEGKLICDKGIGFWQLIAGTAYRWVFPDVALEGEIFDEAPFEINYLPPTNTFVVYQDGIKLKPLMAGYELGGTTIDGLPDTRFVIYTRNHYYVIKSNKIENHKPYSLGAVPIIEYPANFSRQGAFEPVLDILKAINGLESNRVDGVEQLVQSYLVFKNCEIDTALLEQMRELGAIQVASGSGDSKNADVDLLSAELSQDQVQVLIKDLYNRALKICDMPDREGGSRSTGDTQQAVVLRDGWAAAEAAAKNIETMFIQSEQEFLKIILKILRTNGKLKNVKLSDIGVQFTRNRTDNLLIKTQGMLNQLSAGINPRIVIATSGLYSDPEQVYLDSLEYLEKWKVKEENAEDSDSYIGERTPKNAITERTEQTQNNGERTL